MILSRSRFGRDSAEPCAICGRPVLVSQVVSVYTVAARAWWFVSGECEGCQAHVQRAPELLH
jgi:MinD superfamily P-loop ATPase